MVDGFYCEGCHNCSDEVYSRLLMSEMYTGGYERGKLMLSKAAVRDRPRRNSGVVEHVYFVCQDRRTHETHS